MLLLIVTVIAIFGLRTEAYLGKVGDESDIGLNVVELIEKYGYPIETHYVKTEDNYILALHRIPYGLKNNDTTNRIPVMIQHGLMSSSADFINMGPERSIGYLLADRGYDVWLCNARGNTWSRNHTTLDPDLDNEQFYQFSWHEVGFYDLPAIIDHILNVTGQKDVHYIGHSQGTTEIFVMASERPEYNDKVRLASLMAPVVFMSHLSDPITQLLCQYVFEIEDFLDEMRIFELPATHILRKLGEEYCRDESQYQRLCLEILFFVGGDSDPEQIDNSTLPIIFTNAPANVARDAFVHYGQEINSGHFRNYDYGTEKNLEIYGSEEPPDYDLSKVTIPIALYRGPNDNLVADEDIATLVSKLSNVANNYLVPHDLFNHIDFLYAIDVVSLLYNEMFEVIDKY